MSLHLQETIAELDRISRDYLPAKFAHSLSSEDVVLAHLLKRYAEKISIFTLDTGRLNSETYQLLDQLVAEGQTIKVFYPSHVSVEKWVAEHGINGFYRDLQARKDCCHVRKVEPLTRALSGCRAWLTGQRREQSVTRSTLPLQQHDAVYGIEKFNPLAAWSRAEIWNYIKDNQLRYNKLHDQGYASIGCAPCTRAITVGEDERAGRWWWENPESKECGLHARQIPSS